jgi:hypothetical protein
VILSLRSASTVPIPRNIEIVSPWKSVEDSPEIKNQAEHLSARLKEDLPPKHVLQGLKVRAVALRIDRDNVLFEIEGHKMLLAVVHMTWRHEKDSRWPVTKFYQTWEQWVRDDMLPAHDEYALS